MFLTNRLCLFATVILSTIICAPDVGLAQLTPVDVPPRESVSTTFTLPVAGAINPAVTYITVYANYGLIPTFKVYPEGGSISDELKIDQTTMATINFDGKDVGDVQLSVDTNTNIYTLYVSHFNDVIPLGTNNDDTLDDWILELSYGDANTHRFHFFVSHTIIPPGTWSISASNINLLSANVRIGTEQSDKEVNLEVKGKLKLGNAPIPSSVNKDTKVLVLDDGIIKSESVNNLAIKGPQGVQGLTLRK